MVVSKRDLLFAELAFFVGSNQNLFKDKTEMVEWLYSHIDWDCISDSAVEAGLKLWRKHPDVARRSTIAVIKRWKSGRAA